MMRRFLATVLCAIAFPALAQRVPASNYSDIWWNPDESGWRVTFTQHSATHQVCGDPAFGMPSFSGTKTIQRQGF